MFFVRRPSRICAPCWRVGAKFPNVGQAFYEAGPMVGAARLAAYLDAQVLAGVIETDDTQTAAFHFLDMCKGPHMMRGIFGISERPSDAVIEAHVSRTTDAFLRAYGKRGG